MPFSLVPGFAQRYPKEDDDERHSRLDRESAPVDAPSPVPADGLHARRDRASLLIETCCTTLDEALSAQARGANRIELCTDLSFGGITPPHDLIREVVQALTIPVNVLIRPLGAGVSIPERLAELDPSQRPALGPSLLHCRGWHGSGMETPAPEGRKGDGGFSYEDFVYDEEEVQQMMADIEFCKSVGVAGIVVGALTPDGAIDRAAMKRLIAAARPLPVTFHRAFDVCTADPFLALDQIIALGCTRLLTSGMATTAWDGRCLITLLVRRAGSRLIVMPGRGVTPANLVALAAATHATEFHGTAIP